MGPWNIFRKNCCAMKYLGLWSPRLRKNFGKCVKPSSPTSYILNVRSLISMLNKIFGRHLTVFDVFTDTTAKFINFFLLPWVRTIQIHFSLMSRLLLLLVLFACLCVYYVIIDSGSSVFVSTYLNLYMFLWVGILYYKCTII